jgi:hypothetical protein
MPAEQFLDGLPVFLELLVQDLELSGQGHGQAALGAGDGWYVCGR